MTGAVLVWATGKNPPYQKYDDGWYHLMVSSRSQWLTDANVVLNVVGSAGMVIYSAALFMVLLRRHWRLALFTAGAILSLAMMYSHTYLVVHWLSDTVAGAMLGVGVTSLLWAAMSNKYLPRNISPA